MTIYVKNIILESSQIVLKDNIFTNNSAIEKGGGLCFANILPNSNFINYNFFSKNSANYGENFASYPIRILLREPNSTNMFYNKTLFQDISIPGLQINHSLSFIMIDHFQQLVNLDLNS